MKAILFSIVLFFLFCLQNDLKGQTNFKWGKQFGTNMEEVSFNITADLSGNVYVAGFTNGIMSVQNYGKSDAFVTKLDSSGAIRWTNQFGTTEDEQISDITTDSMGNIYVTGYTTGLLGTEKFGVEDVFVAKFDSSGVTKWKKQFGTNSRDVANGIFIDSSGDIYIAGETVGLFGDSICGSTDCFILKLDNEGNKKSSHQFGTLEIDYCNDIVVDSAMNIYVSGSTYGNLGAKNIGQDDVFVAIFDNQMKPIRYMQFGTISNDGYSHIALDKEENIYVGGSTGGNLSGKQLGQGDSFLAKLNTMGETLWINQFGMPGWDGVHGIVIDEEISENIIVSGCQNWSACQSFVRLFRKDGKLVGFQDFATIERGKGTCGRTSCIDNSGNIYHTGLTNENLFSTVLGAHDIFLIKLSINTNSTKLYVNASIENQSAVTENQFVYIFPDTIFKSEIGTTNLTYSACSNNGTLLPSWLSFDPNKRTFSGIPVAAGTFNIKIIAIDDSKASSSCVFTIIVKKKMVSVENTPLNYIKIFPNPTNDQLELSFGKTTYKEAIVNISDIQGKNTYSNTYSNIESATVNLSGNPKGIYFVKLFIDGEMYSRKITLN
jgi:hypothetical protein